MYILNQTKHPVATGGSPIVTWLPNQLDSVLQTIRETQATIDRSALSPEHRALVDEIAVRADAQQRVLTKEVAKLTAERGAAAVDVDGAVKVQEGYAATA